MVVMKMLLHVDDVKITACVIQIMSLRCYSIYVKFQIEKHCLVKHYFCFPEKRLLSISKFCASRNLYFFLRATDWFTTNFLGPKYC